MHRSTTASTSVRTRASSPLPVGPATGPQVREAGVVDQHVDGEPPLGQRVRAGRPGPPGSVRSAGTTSTRTPWSRSSSAASAVRASARRATSVTPRRRAASWRASSAPMPDEAPVTRHVRSGWGRGKAMPRS